MRRQGGLARRPGPPVANDERLQLGQRPADGAELVRRHADPEVLVLPRLPALEEVERPAGEHVPGRVRAL